MPIQTGYTDGVVAPSPDSIAMCQDSGLRAT